MQRAYGGEIESGGALYAVDKAVPDFVVKFNFGRCVSKCVCVLVSFLS